ncbi:MAG: flagellar hook-basal body complex protein, partial [Alphaproteobacteria bacterium]
RLPIGTFPNPNGLNLVSGNAFSATDRAGDFFLNDAGSGSAGAIAAGALEQSGVDLAEEFTNMIIVQRAYSAGTKVITTADEMLDELVRVKR